MVGKVLRSIRLRWLFHRHHRTHAAPSQGNMKMQLLSAGDGGIELIEAVPVRRSCHCGGRESMSNDLNGMHRVCLGQRTRALHCLPTPPPGTTPQSPAGRRLLNYQLDVVAAVDATGSCGEDRSFSASSLTIWVFFFFTSKQL